MDTDIDILVASARVREGAQISIQHMILDPQIIFNPARAPGKQTGVLETKGYCVR